jgi:hypothetical protein
MAAIFWPLVTGIASAAAGGAATGATGGKNSDEPAAAPTPYETASQTAQAQLEYDPQIANMMYQISANPQYGMQANTALEEQTRQNVFPQETAVRDQMLQNILANLISPTGISPEQQGAITARRGTAQDNLVQSMRERANLGGGLFGGRAANAEQLAVGDLQNQFAEEDINRETTARLNALQSALPALQILFPGVNIGSTNYQSSVPSADTAYSGQMGYANNQAQIQAQENQQNNSLYSSLFQNLGNAYANKPQTTAFNQNYFQNNSATPYTGSLMSLR